MRAMHAAQQQHDFENVRYLIQGKLTIRITHLLSIKAALGYAVLPHIDSGLGNFHFSMT